MERVYLRRLVLVTQGRGGRHRRALLAAVNETGIAKSLQYRGAVTQNNTANIREVSYAERYTSLCYKLRICLKRQQYGYFYIALLLAYRE